MQSFTKLVDKVGPPPAAAPDPPALLPGPAPGAPSTAAAETGVPTLAEVGFVQGPSTIFKVSRVSVCSA
jgi:hypothetical protein